VRATFPSDFLWGASVSAYQTEGSLDADGRGRSIWETFAARPGAVEGGGDGSRACDSYRRWAEDVDLVTELGLNAFRFSVSWARIVPEGRGRVESRGLDHYERLVDALLARGVTPVLTLNHWDMPEALMDDGGWVGRSSVDAFTEFTAAVAGRLGDRVRWWITQNEPWIIALLGFQLGIHAPGVRDLRSAVAAGHHVLLAHGTGADAIHAVAPGARVGCALSLAPCDPATDDPRDQAAAWGSDGYVNRWYLDPLLGAGYPADMREHYEHALGGGLDAIIRPGDTARIGGRSDFLGVNYYSRRVMAEGGGDRPFPWRVVGPRGDVARTDQGDEVAPDSLRELLLRLHRDYPGVPLVVTENGAAYGDAPTHDGQVHDQRRTSFLLSHLRAVREAIERGADVLGYFHWSLLDNFEWALGYRPRFGLVYVDYATGRRTVKDSGRLYARIARTGELPDSPPTVTPFG
jgi:beta-glucosidase